MLHKANNVYFWTAHSSCNFQALFFHSAANMSVYCDVPADLYLFTTYTLVYTYIYIICIYYMYMCRYRRAEQENFYSLPTQYQFGEKKKTEFSCKYCLIICSKLLFCLFSLFLLDLLRHAPIDRRRLHRIQQLLMSTRSTRVQ